MAVETERVNTRRISQSNYRSLTFLNLLIIYITQIKLTYSENPNLLAHEVNNDAIEISNSFFLA